MKTNLGKKAAHYLKPLAPVLRSLHESSTQTCSHCIASVAFVHVSGIAGTLVRLGSFNRAADFDVDEDVQAV